MVKIIERPVPVSGLFLASTPEKYYGSAEDTRNNMTCLTNFHQNIVVDAELDYLQPINVCRLNFVNGYILLSVFLSFLRPYHGILQL